MSGLPPTDSDAGGISRATQNLDGLKLRRLGEANSVLSFDLPQGLTKVSCVRFPPSGLTVSLVCGGEIREYDLTTGALVQSALLSSTHITHLEYFPRQPRFAIATEDGLVRVFDSATLTQRSSVTMSRKEKKVCGVLMVHPTKPIIFFSRAGSATIHGYDTDARKEVATKLQAKGRHFHLGEVHSQHPLMVTAFMEGGFRVWDLDTYSVVHDFENVPDGDVVTDSQTRRTRSRSTAASAVPVLITSFHFHPTRKWLLVGDEAGNITMWSIPDPRDGDPTILLLKGAARSAINTLRFVRDSHDIMSISFKKGMSLWDSATFDGSLGPHFASPVTKPKPAERFYAIDMQEACQPGARVQFIDCPDLANDVFMLSTKDVGSAKAARVRVFMEKLSFHNPSVPLSRVPKAVPLEQQHRAQHFLATSHVYAFPSLTLYASKSRILRYHVAKEKSSAVLGLPSIMANNTRFLTRLEATPDRRHVLVCSTPKVAGTEPGSLVHCFECSYNGPEVTLADNAAAVDGEDAVFVGSDSDDPRVVSVVRGGLQIAAHTFSRSTHTWTGEMRWNMPSKVVRVFQTPLTRGKCVLYTMAGMIALSANAAGEEILSVAAMSVQAPGASDSLDWFSSLGSSTFSTQVAPPASVVPVLPVYATGPYMPHASSTFPLRRSESVIAVSWVNIAGAGKPAHLSASNDWNVGVVTTDRVVILDSQLQALVAVEKPQDAMFSQDVMWASSCVWCGYALLVCGHQAIYYVTFDPARPMQSLCSLLQSHSLLCGALNDRLLMVTPAHDGSAVMSCLPTGLLQPLLMGVLDYWRTQHTHMQQTSQEEFMQTIQTLIQRFESTRASKELLLALDDQDMSELAFQLCNVGGCRVSPYLKFFLALKAGHYASALEVLQDRLDTIEFESGGAGLDFEVAAASSLPQVGDDVGRHSIGYVACAAIRGGDLDTALAALSLSEHRLPLLIAMASVATEHSLTQFIERLHKAEMLQEEMDLRCITDAAGSGLGDDLDSVSKSNSRSTVGKDMVQSEPELVDMRVYDPANPTHLLTYIPDLPFENVSQCLGVLSGVGAALGVTGMHLADTIIEASQLDSEEASRPVEASIAVSAAPISSFDDGGFVADFGDANVTTATAQETQAQKELTAQEKAKQDFQVRDDFYSDSDGEKVVEEERPKIRVKFTQDGVQQQSTGADLKAAISSISLVPAMTRTRVRGAADADKD